MQDWIPALEGAEAKLRTGASVADVGCGHGSSTIQMAKAYPMSRFVGYDYHLPSIEAAREAAAKRLGRSPSIRGRRSQRFVRKEFRSHLLFRLRS